jgi:hypothetical protein
MVGMVGLAPTEAVKPGDLQSPAIAAMRHTQGGSDPHPTTSHWTHDGCTLFPQIGTPARI